MLKYSSTGKEEEGEQGRTRYRLLRLFGEGDGAVCDALGEVLQSFRKSVEPIVSLTEDVHVLRTARIEQLLEHAHVIVRGDEYAC